MAPSTYQSVPIMQQDDDYDFEKEYSAFNQQQYKHPIARFLHWIATSRWPWICSTLTFALIATQAVLLDRQDYKVTRGQTLGLRSELDAARETIEYHDIIFTSGVEERPDGRMYLHLPEGQPHYVGAPNPEIDAAWADLTQATEIWIDGDEAETVANRSISSQYGWLVSLDVYHSLHCVNLARKGFDWDYYYGDKPGQEPINYLTREHIYHCLEHLRQVVMCHSDLTPMRFRWSDLREGRGMPVWDEPHSCRSFDQVRQWAEARKRTFEGEVGHGHGDHHG